MKLPSPATYLTGHWLCFDFETTNLAFGSALIPENRVVMLAWKEQGEPTQHHYGNPLEAKAFWEALERAEVVIAHNAKFEQHWLLRLGYDPADLFWFDTMLAEKVGLGNRRKPLDLGAVASRYGYKGKEELIDSLMKSGVCPSDMPEDKLIARCRRDVRTTAQVAQKQIRRLHKLGNLPVLMTKCLLTPVLTHIEATGMVLDAERVKATYHEYQLKAVDLAAQFKKFTGGINLNSSDQMAKFLYQDLKFPEKRTKSGKLLRNKADRPNVKTGIQKWPEGKPRTDKNTMEWLKTVARTKKQRTFIDLRQKYGSVTSALSKNLEFFLGVVEEREGCRFHGQFNQAVAATGRLTATGLPQQFRKYKKAKSVQFQNMPRAFKGLFTVRDPDYVFVDPDGSQLEFRVAAFLGQDSTAMADIRDPNFDAHVRSAAAMFQYEYDGLLASYREGNPEASTLRTEAKSDTFKPLFGGTTGTPEQERYYQAFQERYAELYTEQERWVNEVLGSGKLITEWGARFYWDFYLDDRGTAKDKRTHKPIKPAIFNYKVQSLATGEIIPIALWHLFQRVRAEKLRVRFVNTVHDSTPAECHKDDLARFKQLIVLAFTRDVYRYLDKIYGLQFNVPLGCEIKWGAHWSEGESMKRDIEPTTLLREAA